MWKKFGFFVEMCGRQLEKVWILEMHRVRDLCRGSVEFGGG